MRITKYIQSCLLVETNDRVALFDPGVMSAAALDISRLTRVDDLIITHQHADHMSLDLVKQVVAAFPDVHITAPADVVAMLSAEGIAASDQPAAHIKFFSAPHESVEPLFPLPDEIGVHYADSMSHPGDSHSFNETMPVLALPMTGPWGTNVRAFNLALELKPKFIVPIHDWHWRDEARQQTYDMFENKLAEHGITFLKAETGVALEIDL